MGLRLRNVIDLLRSLEFTTDRFPSPTTKESRDPPPLSEKIVSQKFGFGPPFLRHMYTGEGEVRVMVLSPAWKYELD